MDQDDLDSYTPLESKVERLAQWEKETSMLCEMGGRSNSLILEDWNENADLLFGKGRYAQEFLEQHKSRVDFWKKNPEAAKRAKEFCQEYQKQVSLYSSIGDPFGLYKTLVWLDISTIPLLKEIGSDGTIDDAVKRETASALERISEEGKRRLYSMPNLTSTIFLEKHMESTMDYLRKTGRKNFRNTYGIKWGKNITNYVDVFETWEMRDEDKISLCVPISIGCQNRCKMCDNRAFFYRNLDADEIVRLVFLNLANNRTIPLDVGAEQTAVYYMGGGDAALNPDLLPAIREINRLNPGIKQILSTLGNKTGDRVDELIDEAKHTPNLGFQISVLSLDEKVRKLYLNHDKVFSLEECMEKLEKFHDITGRKAHASIFLLENRYDDPKTIGEQAERLVPKDKVHISLQVMVDPYKDFTHKPAPIESYIEVRDHLKKLGFEVSIANYVKDDMTEITCGKRSEFVMQASKSGAKKHSKRRIQHARR